MENHTHDPVSYLKINLRCCEDCPKKLKKALLKMHGISSVVIDPKLDSVAVIGDIDPLYLLKKIEKWGKTAELLPYSKYHQNHRNVSHESGSEKSHHYSSGSSDDHHHHPKVTKQQKRYDCGHESTGSSHDHRRGSTSSSHDHSHGSTSSSRDSRRGRNDYQGRQQPKDDHVKEEEHVCESYEKPKIDERVCRDFYCKIHNRRPTIMSKVPSINSEDHPHHTGGPYTDAMFEEMGYPQFEQTMPSVQYHPRRMLLPGMGMPRHQEYPFRGRGALGYQEYGDPGRDMPGNEEYFGYR